ncbi:PDZ domain-containing protein [Longimicrobium terrae]|uniref:S1-C subfamily serine protease n=1 Tax=Longimicrobium terrae TaxID=1639882 RepID=A0A841GYH8_9BACT|nr:PDZ domain-containing protein [Longimicrobium terrae]MBB4636673.1 S1-C subfamily serine protease [Longimicrobium terrae]MBB6070803.1 S1-C subfamily serine protease [Longimicrobium terrae]NNC28829.1 PDZ domain-containing protein [Longimicrobium terrae]
MKLGTFTAALALLPLAAGCAHAQQTPPAASAVQGQHSSSGTLTNPNPRPPTAYTGMGVAIPGGGRPVVTRVVPESPAARAGIVAGDEILSIDGVDTSERVTFFRAAVPGQRYLFRVRRGTTQVELAVVPDPPRTRSAN